MIEAVPVQIIFGKMHFLLTSENKFFHEMKYDRVTSSMEFMKVKGLGLSLFFSAGMILQ